MMLRLLLEMSFDISEKSIFPYQKTSDTKYTFKTSENEYIVEFTKYYSQSKTYERTYRSKSKGFRGLTNEGKAIKVIATVTAITLDFMKNNNNWEDIIIKPVSDKRSRVLQLFFNQSYFDNYNIEEVEPNEFHITRKQPINEK